MQGIESSEHGRKRISSPVQDRATEGNTVGHLPKQVELAMQGDAFGVINLALKAHSVDGPEKFDPGQNAGECPFPLTPR